MKKITLLLLACVGLSLVAQKTPYVPPKLEYGDSIAGAKSKLVIYGRIIQNTSLNAGKFTYFTHKIRIYRKFKDELGIKDTCVEVVTSWMDVTDYSDIRNWNPEVGDKGVFFIVHNPFMKNKLGFYDGDDKYMGFHDKSGYGFGHKDFKDFQFYQYIAQMKSLSVPDSLGNEEAYYKRMKADSIARRELQKKQIEAQNLKRRAEMAKNDSFAQAHPAEMDYYRNLSWQEQAAYRKKHDAARDSVINLQRERERKKKAQNKNQRTEAVSINVRFTNPIYTPADIVGLLKNFEFDVELRASQQVYLENLPIWIKYNENVFGSHAAGTSNIDLAFTNNTDYDRPDDTKDDISANEMVFIIGLNYKKTTVTTVPITTAFQKYAHVVMRAKNCAQLPNVIVGSTQNMLNAAMYATSPNIPLSGDPIGFFTDITAQNFTFNDYCGPTITDFSPKTSTVGTGSVLTVRGTGFGKDQGQLLFVNANAPKSEKNTDKFARSANTVDVLGWSDTEVKYVLHSRAKEKSCVGTGPIRLVTAVGDSSSPSESLTVPYSIFNYTYGGKQYPSFPVSPFPHSDGNPREFMILKDAKFPEATAVIIKAIKDLSCYTAINFTYDTLYRDIIYGAVTNRYSTINFGYDSAMINNTILNAYSKSFVEKELCGGSKYWSINYETDIVINNTRVWNFDTTGAAVPQGQYPFYEVILHELGHAAGLDHVCTSSNNLMWPYTSNDGKSATDRYYLGKYAEETVAQGVNWMFEAKDQIGSTCNGAVYMERSKCYTQVGLDDQTFYESIQLYNNPTADGTVSLRFKLLKPELVSFKVVDLMGRTLQEQQKEYTSNEVDEALDLGKQPTGVYGLIVQKGKDVQMFKIVKQ